MADDWGAPANNTAGADWGETSGGDWGSDSNGGEWGGDFPVMVMPGFHLGGNPVEVVNTVAMSIVAGVVGMSVLGYLFDVFFVRRRIKNPPEDRPRGWVLGMLGSSYLLLIPGLTLTLFSFNISELNGSEVLKEIEENMLEFTKELWVFGAYFGVICIVGFAMVIPVVKLVLLVGGGLLRHSGNPDHVQVARRMIHFVQIISKWASPDMFAYILLSYLIRKLDHPPIMNGLFKLDLGFSCFATFCVFSTISSLGVRSPLKPDKDRQAKLPGTLFTLGVAVGCCIVFVAGLVVGMKEPSMSLNLDFDKMVESGELAEDMLETVKILGIADMAKDDVCVWDCLRELWNWSFPKPGQMEVNNLIAFVMFGVFAVIFTIIDMITLLVMAINIHLNPVKPKVALEVTHIFRKLSMLDVAVVGIVVIVLAGSIYAKMGVMLRLNSGLWKLAIAEVAHYVIHYTVVDVASAMPSYRMANQDLEMDLKDEHESDDDTDSDPSNTSTSTSRVEDEDNHSLED